MRKWLKVYKNSIVVVAGGASGIGEQIVRQLAPHVKEIVILDRNTATGSSIAEEITNVSFETIDMNKYGEVKTILRNINKRYGTIDFFFNLAGTFMAGEIRDTPIEKWQQIFESNITPIANGTSVIYEIMRSNGHGHIINTASSAGLFPVPIMNIYGATKSAVISLTQGLHMEAKTFGIRVSVACPTIVETPLYNTALYAGLDKSKALDYLKNQANIQQPDAAAYEIIKGASKNKLVIHTAFSTRLGWGVYRISNGLYLRIAERVFERYRKTLRKEK